MDKQEMSGIYIIHLDMVEAYAADFGKQRLYNCRRKVTGDLKEKGLYAKNNLYHATLKETLDDRITERLTNSQIDCNPRVFFARNESGLSDPDISKGPIEIARDISSSTGDPYLVVFDRSKCKKNNFEMDYIVKDDVSVKDAIKAVYKLQF